MALRVFVLLLLIGIMSVIVHTNFLIQHQDVSSTLVLGFLLLSSYCIGYLLEMIRLPRITGYIISGLVFGPYFMQFVSTQNIIDISFINTLALAFIAFCAGGELKISNILDKVKSISYLVAAQTFVVFFGVSAVVFFLVDIIPVFSGSNLPERITISLMFGIISVARSPSSTIAIISETKAKGDYTDIVLSVTIVKDVVVIVLFGITISLCQVLISPQASFNWAFFIFLLFEITIAIVAGFFLGKGIIFLIERVKAEFSVVVIGMGFLVVKFSHLLGSYFHETYHIAVNLEPLLICMSAGFTVQNYSKQGKTFLFKMDRISLPIFILFFAITGASINIDVLRTSWIFGFIIVGTRLFMLFAASYLSGKLSGDSPRIYKNSWLGFITQAGVSLGLLNEIVRRFPELGIPIQSILIAAITINQIIGPIAFKYALNKVGETHV